MALRGAEIPAGRHCGAVPVLGSPSHVKGRRYLSLKHSQVFTESLKERKVRILSDRSYGGERKETRKLDIWK